MTSTLLGQETNLLTSTPYPDSSTPTTSTNTAYHTPLHFVPLSREMEIIEKAKRDALIRSGSSTTTTNTTTPTVSLTEKAGESDAAQIKTVPPLDPAKEELNRKMLKKDVLAPELPSPSIPTPFERDLLQEALQNPLPIPPQTPAPAQELPPTTSTPPPTPSDPDIIHLRGMTPTHPIATTETRLKIVSRESTIPAPPTQPPPPTPAPAPVVEDQPPTAIIPDIETAPKLDPLPPSFLSSSEKNQAIETQEALAIDLAPTKPRPTAHPTATPPQTAEKAKPAPAPSDTSYAETKSEKPSQPTIVQANPTAIQETLTRSKFDPQVITNQSLVERSFSRITEAESRAAEEWVMQTLAPVQPEQVFTSRQ